MAAHLLSSCLHSGMKKAEGIRKKEWHLYLERKNFPKLLSRLWLIRHWPKWCHGELLKRKWEVDIEYAIVQQYSPLDPLFNLLHPFCPGHWLVWIASLSSWGFGFQFGLASGSQAGGWRKWRRVVRVYFLSSLLEGKPDLCSWPKIITFLKWSSI